MADAFASIKDNERAWGFCDGPSNSCSVVKYLTHKFQALNKLPFCDDFKIFSAIFLKVETLKMKNREKRGNDGRYQKASRK